MEPGSAVGYNMVSTLYHLVFNGFKWCLLLDKAKSVMNPFLKIVSIIVLP